MPNCPSGCDQVFERVFPSLGRVLEAGLIPVFEASLGAENQRDGKEPEYKPNLICRAFIGDGGSRPLATSVVFYESPDIWVVAPDGSDVPIAGVMNQIKVHVWNLGLAPSYGVNVDLYVCDPSVGVNLASAKQVGSTQTTMLNAGEHKILSFDWIPEFFNDGHECLVAHVYDPVADNLVAPFNPVQDRHVAQHNINQIRIPAGKQMNVHFFVPNLSLRPTVSEIQIENVRGDALTQLALGLGISNVAEFRGANAQITKVETLESRPNLRLDQHQAVAVLRETLEPIPHSYTRGLLQAELSTLPIAEHKSVSRMPTVAPAIQPAERAISQVRTETRVFEIPPRTELRVTLTITLPTEVRRGTYTAFRVIERIQEQISGGVTYLVFAE